METSWHSYPKIYNLGHRAIRDLLEDPVVVEEKVDGCPAVDTPILCADEPKDIGPLIHEIHRDLTDECSEEIAAILLKWMLPNVLRGCVGGFPEWYKAQLAGRQFED